MNEDSTQIESQIAQNLVNESEVSQVNINVLKHFCDHFRQLGNLINISSQLTENVMKDLKQAYLQSKCHEATCHLLQIPARN